MSIRTRRLLIGLFVVLAFLVVAYVELNLVVFGVGKKFFRDASDIGYSTAVWSLGTLDLLERGDVDGVKRLLASNVAGYCKSGLPDADPTRKAHFRELAEKVSTRSPALKERLSKSAP
jgi:hypothetical protein